MLGLGFKSQIILIEKDITDVRMMTLEKVFSLDSNI